MFTKYFGLFLIAGGIVASFISLFFTGLYVDRFTGAIKIDDKELPFGIFLFIAIISVTFFIGKYFYKTGKMGKTLANLKINKLVKIAAILFAVSILIILISFFGTRMFVENESIWQFIFVIYLGIFPAMIMSGVAIILLIIHWLKNRGLKYKQ